MSGKVLLTDGQFNIASKLVIAKPSIDFCGYGHSSLLKATAILADDILEVTEQYASVHDLRLDGALQTAGNGLVFNRPAPGQQYSKAYGIDLENIYGIGLRVAGGSDWRGHDIRTYCCGTGVSIETSGITLTDYLLVGDDTGLSISNGGWLYFYAGRIWGCVNYGIDLIKGAWIGFQGLDVDNLGKHGIYIHPSVAGNDVYYVLLDGIHVMETSKDGNDVYDGIHITRTGSGLATKVVITNSFLSDYPYARYALFSDCPGSLNVYRNPLISSISVPFRSDVIVEDNPDILGSQETRMEYVALTPGLADAFTFNWQNPYDKNCIVKRIVVYIWVSGGTATAVLNIGVASNTGVESDNLIDGLDLNQTGVFDNLGNPGTNGKTVQILNAKNGANDWITGVIKVANASSLAGRVFIELRATP
jgi:hypothetical protein